jgi:glycosyltransferase involved in cell wall biosynthesis
MLVLVQLGPSMNVKPSFSSALKPAIFVYSTTYDPFIGGAEISIREVVLRLSSHYRFVIFTARMRKDLAPVEVKDGATIVRIGLGSSLDKFLLTLIGPFHVLRYERRYHPIIHWGVMVTYASLIPWILNLFSMRKRSLLLTLQEGQSEAYLEKGRGGMIDRAWCWMLRSESTAVTAISTYLAERARRLGHRKAVSIIPNGVDVSRFSIKVLKEERDRIRAELDIPTSATVLISTSRLVEKNGLDILISSLQFLSPDVKRKMILLILGSGVELAPLKELALRTRVSSIVRFLGSVSHSEVPRWLLAADIFSRPSRSEGMGNSFVEAMAAGLPVIGTPVGGIPDLIEDGITGLFSLVEDPRDLAGKIERLATDAKMRSTVGNEGRKKAIRYFNWDSIAEAYRNEFESHKVARPLHVLIGT